SNPMARAPEGRSCRLARSTSSSMKQTLRKRVTGVPEKYRGDEKNRVLSLVDCSRRSDLAHPDEGSPVVRVGVRLPKREHGVPQGERSVRLLPKPSVEELHELRRRPILDVPQGDEERAGARAEEAADETEELVSVDDDARARGARAEGDQPHGQPQVIEI